MRSLRLLGVGAVLLSVPACAARQAQPATMFTELSGQEVGALQVAVVEAGLTPEQITSTDVLNRSLDEGVEITFVPRTEVKPGERLIGDPTGQAITIVVGERGGVVRRHRNR